MTLENETMPKDTRYKVVMVQKSPINTEIINRRHQDFKDRDTVNDNFERKNLKKQHMYQFFKFNEMGPAVSKIDLTN